MWITLWKTVEKPRNNFMLIHTIVSKSHGLGISTVFCEQCDKVFHAFTPKKDINLLSLHNS